jgi:predicted transcriptional regulator
MTATAYLNMTCGSSEIGNVGKVHIRYMCYILNKEHNYTQKDIASALGISSKDVSSYIKNVDTILLGRFNCHNELQTTRLYLQQLGYKKLQSDVRSVVHL